MKYTVRNFHGKLYFIPLGFFILDVLLMFYFLMTGNSLAGRYAFIFCTAGIIAAWVSFITGVIALLIIRKNTVASGIAFVHGIINSVALMVLTMLWIKTWQVYPQVQVPGTSTVFFKLLMIAILSVGIYLGKTNIPKHL